MHQSDNTQSYDTLVEYSTASELSVDRVLEASGLKCPLPLLKAKLELNGMEAGQRLRVFATDQGSLRDFHAFAKLSGHRVECFAVSNGTYQYIVEKAN